MPVHEIAVRVVKPGAEDAFARRRAAFIAKLKTQGGVQTDREFESFLALPTPDERPVFIGMTTYEALGTVNRIQMNPLVMMKFVPFMMTMSLKAYYFVEQVGGDDFDLARLGVGSGQLIHVALRRTLPESRDAFAAAQERFLAALRAQPGVGEHFEFQAVKGSHHAEVTAGITVFESEQALSDAFDTLAEHPISQTYFETFVPLASQFARSIDG